MKTTINWRPYPEQKPPSPNAWPQHILCYSQGRMAFIKGRNYKCIGVTHFALPEDIITEEA